MKLIPGKLYKVNTDRYSGIFGEQGDVIMFIEAIEEEWYYALCFLNARGRKSVYFSEKKDRLSGGRKSEEILVEMLL